MNHPALLRCAPALLLALLIPALSLLPAAFFRGVPAPARFPGADKLVHALMYAALALALFRALPPVRRASLAAALAVALSASLYGLALEIAQSLLTSTRHADPLDALANAAGAFTAALLCKTMNTPNY